MYTPHDVPLTAGSDDHRQENDDLPILRVGFCPPSPPDTKSAIRKLKLKKNLSICAFILMHSRFIYQLRLQSVCFPEHISGGLSLGDFVDVTTSSVCFPEHMHLGVFLLVI